MADVLTKKDCFAYRNTCGKHYCAALSHLYCKEEKCKFYKNKKQFESECQKYGYYPQEVE